jgi:hypothetical protein
MLHVFNNMRGRGEALRELFLGYTSLGISRVPLCVQSRQRADTKEMQIIDSHGIYSSPLCVRLHFPSFSIPAGGEFAGYAAHADNSLQTALAVDLCRVNRMRKSNPTFSE